jgi:hypothetical protein
MGGAGHVAHREEITNTYTILVGNAERKIPFKIPRRGWEDNVKSDHRKIVLNVMDWSNLAQDRDHWRAVVKTVMNLRVL